MYIYIYIYIYISIYIYIYTYIYIYIYVCPAEDIPCRPTPEEGRRGCSTYTEIWFTLLYLWHFNYYAAHERTQLTTTAKLTTSAGYGHRKVPLPHPYLQCLRNRELHGLRVHCRLASAASTCTPPKQLCLLFRDGRFRARKADGLMCPRTQDFWIWRRVFH